MPFSAWGRCWSLADRLSASSALGPRRSGIDTDSFGIALCADVRKEAGGAKRWLQVGRVSFQPAELCKLTLVLYLAHRLATPQQLWRSRFLRQYLPLAGVIGVFFSCTLLQPDFGTAVLLLGIAAIVLFIGGVPLRYLLSSLLVATPFLYVALVEVGFRWRRLLAFWDPWSVRLEAGFQIVQSLMAFGKGGASWGSALGQASKSYSSYQKLIRISSLPLSVRSSALLAVSPS